jgi:dihydroflavonol-4-reductase
MKIAVTGSTGHVGGNLVRALIAAGHQIRAVVHTDRRRAIDGLKVELAHADVRNLDSLVKAFAGVELVYHTAARISIAPGDEELVHETNVGGVANVVEACLRNQVRRLVHFSSIHAFEPKPVDERIDEQRPINDGVHALPYDRSKANGERQVRAGLERGLDAVIVNPTAIVGPHDYEPSRVGSVLLDLYRRRLPGLVDGGFDWVDVRDVVAGAIAAAERGKRGEKYLLSGERRTVRELATVAEEVTGKRAPRFVSPMWLARVGAPFATTFAKLTQAEPRFTSASLHALRNHQLVNHDKATRELDYRPRPLPETIADTYAWFREVGAIQ